LLTPGLLAGPEIARGTSGRFRWCRPSPTSPRFAGVKVCGTAP